MPRKIRKAAKTVANAARRTRLFNRRKTGRRQGKETRLEMPPSFKERHGFLNLDLKTVGNIHRKGRKAIGDSPTWGGPQGVIFADLRAGKERRKNQSPKKKTQK